MSPVAWPLYVQNSGCWTENVIFFESYIYSSEKDLIIVIHVYSIFHVILFCEIFYRMSLPSLPSIYQQMLSALYVLQ